VRSLISISSRSTRRPSGTVTSARAVTRPEARVPRLGSTIRTRSSPRGWLTTTSSAATTSPSAS
jgi:hypothetical protein